MVVFPQALFAGRLLWEGPYLCRRTSPQRRWQQGVPDGFGSSPGGANPHPRAATTLTGGGSLLPPDGDRPEPVTCAGEDTDHLHALSVPLGGCL